MVVIMMVLLLMMLMIILVAQPRIANLFESKNLESFPLYTFYATATVPLQSSTYFCAMQGPLHLWSPKACAHS